MIEEAGIVRAVTSFINSLRDGWSEYSWQLEGNPVYMADLYKQQGKK